MSTADRKMTGGEAILTLPKTHWTPIVGFYSDSDTWTEGQLIYALEDTRDGKREIIEAQKQIRSLDGIEERRGLKEKLLPGFTLGRFRDCVSPKYCMVAPGMIMDIGPINGSDFQETFDRVCSIPEVHAAYRDPTGDAITAFLLFDKPLETTGFEDNLLPDIYERVYNYYAKLLFGMEMTGKIGQVCYAAHDPNLFLNPYPKFLDPEMDAQSIIDIHFKDAPSGLIDAYYVSLSRAKEREDEFEKFKEELRDPVRSQDYEEDLPF